MTAKELSPIDTIKDKYSKLKCKGEFVELLAKDRGRTVNSVRQHWIQRWNIPEAHQARTIELLDEVLRLENKFEQEKNDLLNK